MTKKDIENLLIELLIEDDDENQIDTFEEVGALTRDAGFYLENDYGKFKVVISEW